MNHLSKMRKKKLNGTSVGYHKLIGIEFSLISQKHWMTPSRKQSNVMNNPSIKSNSKLNEKQEVGPILRKKGRNPQDIS